MGALNCPKCQGERDVTSGAGLLNTITVPAGGMKTTERYTCSKCNSIWSPSELSGSKYTEIRQGFGQYFSNVRNGVLKRIENRPRIQVRVVNFGADDLSANPPRLEEIANPKVYIRLPKVWNTYLGMGQVPYVGTEGWLVNVTALRGLVYGLNISILKVTKEVYIVTTDGWNIGIPISWVKELKFEDANDKGDTLTLGFFPNEPTKEPKVEPKVETVEVKKKIKD